MQAEYWRHALRVSNGASRQKMCAEGCFAGTGQNFCRVLEDRRTSWEVNDFEAKNESNAKALSFVWKGGRLRAILQTLASYSQVEHVGTLFQS